MATVDFNRILASLATAGLQQKQPAIYQTIKSILEGSAQLQTNVVGQINVVNTALSSSLTFGTSTERGNYKPVTTAGNLIFWFETNTSLLWVFADNAWFQVSGDNTATYLTVNNETAALPNSRRVLAGTNVTFDDSVAGVRTINVSAASTPGGSNHQVQYNNAGAFGGIPSVSAGYVLVDNGTGTTPSFQPVSATGGIRTYTSAYGSPPASPASGDLWFPSDSFFLLRYNGTSWVPWGPVFPLTPPDNSLFSWVNQGSATVSVSNGGIYLNCPTQASNSWHLRMKSAPATPYKITMGFISNQGYDQQQYTSLIFRNSVSGKFQHWSIANIAASGDLGCLVTSKWDSPTVFNSDYKIDSGTPITPMGLHFLRIADDGVNRICSYSHDGINFSTFFSVGRTDYITADQVGFGVSDSTNKYDMAMTVISWLES